MSTYLRQTKHPETDEWHNATWTDDYFGSHHYGVKFPNGDVFDPKKTKLETRDGDADRGIVHFGGESKEVIEAEDRWHDEQVTYTNTEKRLEEVLQSETHNDDLGIVFTRVGNKYYCSIDWQGGEMNFELGFIHQALAEDRERMRERMGELTIYRNNKGVTEIEENTGYYKASEITSSLQDNNPLLELGKTK